MKITDVKLTVLETDLPERGFDLIKLPGQHRERWLHAATHRPGTLPSLGSGGSDRKQHEFVMYVETDEGVTGVCTANGSGTSRLAPEDVPQLKRLVVGENPLDRELLYQKLHQGTRWVYREPGWFGGLDNCLWDIAGKVAGLPVYHLLGRVRERTPAYYNIRGATKDEAADDARKAIDLNFTGVKDHFYHPVRENIEWLSAMREAVGPDIDLMHDCVGIYTYDEAMRVGRALEELDYRWFEEPLPERFHNKLVQLCERLEIPVLATEMFMYDVDMCAQWLISGATDMVRANARHGTTPLMKLAHLAELHGATIELNGAGGLWGLVHSHLLSAIQNTSYYEYFPGGSQDEVGRSLGMMNPVVPVDGYISAPDSPGWGAEWDWDLFRKRTVATY